MNTFVKIGAALTLIAAVMTAGFYSYIKADERSTKFSTPAERAYQSENRPITAAINEIEMNGSVDVIVKQGEAASMSVSAEKRNLAKLRTELKGNVLVISMDNISFSRKPTKVEITLPQLQRIALHGSGDADLQGFKGEQLAIAVNGSGDLSMNGQFQRLTASLHGSGAVNLGQAKSKSIELEVLGSGDVNVGGDTESLVARINGSGDIDAENLHADQVTLTMNGSGDSSVYAKQAVTANLRGSGDARVYGKPTQRNINRTGSGEVEFD